MIWIVAILTAFTPSGDAVFGGCCGPLKPKEHVCRSEWCEQNLYLPEEFSASPGPFRFDGREYQKEIVDALDDPLTREIVIAAVPQVGKTEILRAIVCSQGEVGAAPMMFAGPDQPYCREQREIIYRMCDSSPVLRSRVPPERLRNDRWIDLRACYAYLAWSGSTQRLSGRSCQLVLCSEVDRWQSSIHLATKRTRAFWRPCVVFEGSLIGASPTLWGLHQGSDRRHFLVPCPVCGHRQELRFFVHKAGPYAGCGGVAGLQDEKGKWRSAKECRDAAYYVCEKGCRIEPGQKAGMVRVGVWCPDGCTVDEAGNITGTPANQGRRRGYQLNALYAPTVTFGDAAEAWIQHRDSELGIQSFWNDWLGLPYVPRGDTPRWKDLGVRLAGTHTRGIVSRGAYFLTAAADVQLRGVYWIVRAWGDRKTSWLVDFGFVPKKISRRQLPGDDFEREEEELASDIAQLEPILLQRRFPVDGENPRGYTELAVRVLGLDRGYRPTDVMSFLRAHPGTRVLAVFGDPKISPGTLYRPMKTERDAETGKVVEDDPRCWGIETNAYKSENADRWQADRTRPGAWWLPSDILTTEGGEDYLRQITAESRLFEAVNGRKAIRWKLISHDMPNHYWDVETYASCLADMVVGNDWNAENWIDQRQGNKERLVGESTEAEDYSAR